jgi:hypothetical protein
MDLLLYHLYYKHLAILNQYLINLNDLISLIFLMYLMYLIFLIGLKFLINLKTLLNSNMWRL